MKLILCLLTFGLFACASQQKAIVDRDANKLFSVEGRLTQSSSYCGGVHPTEEQEREYHRERPFQTKLYVRSGNLNSENSPLIDSVITDGLGYFKFNLPKGDYVIILPSQLNKSSIDAYKKMETNDLHVDNLCLSNWWKVGLFQVTVSDSNISGLKHNFHQRCFVPAYLPCFDYTGPYPP